MNRRSTTEHAPSNVPLFLSIRNYAAAGSAVVAGLLTEVNEGTTGHILTAALAGGLLVAAAAATEAEREIRDEIDHADAAEHADYFHKLNSAYDDKIEVAR